MILFVLQALITGLAVMCPDDPHQFIIDNLKYLIEFGTDELEWFVLYYCDITQAS